MLKQILIFFITCLILLLTNYFLPNILNPYIFMILIYCGINIILGVSLNIINGITGQFSIGHAGFMAVGAYVSAALSFYVFSSFKTYIILTHVFFIFSLIVGGLTASLFGYLVGLPSLRLRGDYLGIVTLGFAEIIRVFILNMDFLGGARGFTGIPILANFFWVGFFVIATIVVSFRLKNSYQGRALLSIREDEIAAESIGIPITHYKIKAFVVSSFFAGIAGGLFAHFIGYLNPSSFTFLKSFEVIIIVVLGGIGSISGSIIAALITTILPEILRPLRDITQIDFRMVIYPLLLLILMLTRPQGLFGNKEINFRKHP